MRIKFSLVAAVVFLLGGCAVALSQADDPLDFFRDDVNLMQQNYAAADYMIEQAKTFIQYDDVIKAMPLQNSQEPRLVSNLDRKIPEQIGERLTQLGYNLDLTAVNTTVAPAYARTPLPATATPDFILTGTYYRKRGGLSMRTLEGDRLNIRLRIADAMTGEPRASYDYTLPLTGDLKAVAKPKPAISRTAD